MKLSHLIIENLKNKRYQYIIIGVLFFILNLCVLTTTYLTEGLNNGIEIAKNKLGADIILTSKNDDNKTIESIYDGIPTSSTLSIDYDELQAISEVTKCCKRLYLATLEGASCCDNKIQLIAVEHEDYLLQILTKKAIQDGTIIIGSNVSGEIGQTVTYYGKTFLVADVLEKSGTGYDYSGFITYNDANTIIKNNLDKLSEYKENDISAVFISSDNPTLTRNILNNHFGKDVSIYLTDHKIAEYTKSVSGVKIIAKIITGFLIISSILAITTIMSLMLLNRRNEVGILILSGYKKRHIHTLFLKEAMIVVFISTLFSFLFFSIVTTMSKPYLEQILHCPLGTVSNGLIISLLFLCNTIFIDVIIYVILRNFYKKDACVLLKEIN